MTIESVERAFQKSVAAQVRLVADGAGRYRVGTPFVLDDGDHLIIILKAEGAKWVLSDEGHTCMHLTDYFDAKDWGAARIRASWPGSGSRIATASWFSTCLASGSGKRCSPSRRGCCGFRPSPPWTERTKRPSAPGPYAVG